MQPIVALGWANGCRGGKGTDEGETWHDWDEALTFHWVFVQLAADVNVRTARRFAAIGGSQYRISVSRFLNRSPG